MANESSGSSRKPVGQIIARGDRTWLVRIYVGRNPQTGKRQYDNHTVRGTKKDAQTYLNGKLRERDLGTYAGVQHTLIGTLLDDLLANYKINEQDYDWAEGKVRVNLRPFFGAMKAASVGTDQPISRSGGNRRRASMANENLSMDLQPMARSTGSWHCFGAPILSAKGPLRRKSEQCRSFPCSLKTTYWRPKPDSGRSPRTGCHDDFRSQNAGGL